MRKKSVSNKQLPIRSSITQEEPGAISRYGPTNCNTSNCSSDYIPIDADNPQMQKRDKREQ